MLHRALLAALVVLAFVGGMSCVIHTTDTSVGSVSSDGSVYLGWHLFSKKKSEKEVFNVGKSVGAFSAVRLHSNNKLDVHGGMTIIFGNGERYKPKLRRDFAKGHWSRWIQLPGGKRHIHSIVVTARAAGKHLAKLEIYGKPAE